MMKFLEHIITNIKVKEQQHIDFYDHWAPQYARGIKGTALISNVLRRINWLNNEWILNRIQTRLKRVLVEDRELCLFKAFQYFSKLFKTCQDFSRLFNFNTFQNKTKHSIQITGIPKVRPLQLISYLTLNQSWFWLRADSKSELAILDLISTISSCYCAIQLYYKPKSQQQQQ